MSIILYMFADCMRIRNKLLILIGKPMKNVKQLVDQLNLKVFCGEEHRTGK